ncbi:MAG: hypothetical protein HYR56_05185 [Acidobacteria bacterium]|nr:hypothetical protein [Acidobacteriota bacterium]MBI3423638.1 hypothetical protein [Acidobacteriota bacterium]
MRQETFLELIQRVKEVRGIALPISVNQQLGITSAFHDEHGYYADSGGLATVVLPSDWQERLQPLADDSGQIIAHCLELYDVAVSKLMASRDQDWGFLA